MHLSDEEKKELLEDAQNTNRRAEFRRLKVPMLKSMDDYIHYLSEIQKIFGPFPISYKKILTGVNKL